MKVIWIVNTLMPAMAAHPDIKGAASATWLENMLANIKAGVTLRVCCPVAHDCRVHKLEEDGVIYYGIPRKYKRGDKYEKKLSDRYEKVFKEELPDVIHIWGTEFPHTLSAVEAAERCGLINRTVISIQGMVSVYARHFMAGVPFWARYLMTPKNFIRGYNLFLTKKSYQKRGEYERRALRKVKHVIGRTEWDRACISQINSSLCYHKNNESMREIFYQAEWKYEACVPHSIFLSQGASPIKGTHLLLEAMEILKKKYPSVHLYTTGRTITGRLTLKQCLSLNPYDWYIRSELRRRKLEENITFLGTLNAVQMCEQYQRANAFVLPSVIENSPNSLGEAMLVGTPCAAADVGGVSGLADSTEVFIYPWDEPYMLAHYLDKIFQNGQEIGERAERARKHAERTHDAKKNAQELRDIYTEMIHGQGKDSWGNRSI